MAVGNVLAGLARALCHRAAAKGAGAAEDAAGGELGFVCIWQHEIYIIRLSFSLMQTYLSFQNGT